MELKSNSPSGNMAKQTLTTSALTDLRSQTSEVTISIVALICEKNTNSTRNVFTFHKLLKYTAQHTLEKIIPQQTKHKTKRSQNLAM